MKIVLLILLLAPLLGALYQVLLGRRFSRRLAESVSCAAILLSLLMAGTAFRLPAAPEPIVLGSWFQVDTFAVEISLGANPMALLMALLVTFVSSLITLYSVGYMGHDRDYPRYFGYLNLFVFFMLVIVLADNLVWLFLGWEGVGFCSYALIGFWHEERANAQAGRKAFLLTRIGDVGFGLAIGLSFVTCHSLSIAAINAQAATLSSSTALLLGLLLLWSAVGKSAQLPLLVWLPDAMAGPTPVSALIHAATMVTAGVYLLLRFFPILAVLPHLLQAIAALGTVTALYAACAALVQKEIKLVLAYSTISQVGFMFLAIGTGDLVGSFYHLLTHAFFKSALFLVAGAITQALDGERDISRMGSIVRRQLPGVCLVFLLASMALAGVPPAAGFFSKGRILLATLRQGGIFYPTLGVVAACTAFLTTLYTFRLFFMAVTGPSTASQPPKIQAIPTVMLWVLWPLGLLAFLAGLLNLPHREAGGWLAGVLAPLPGALAVLPAPPALEWWIEGGDLILALSGVLCAYLLYGPRDLLGWRGADPTANSLSNCFYSGFGLNRLYDHLWVQPYGRLSLFLWQGVDEAGLDRGLRRAVGVFPRLAGGVQGWSTGLLSTSLKMMLLGLTVFLIFLTL